MEPKVKHFIAQLLYELRELRRKNELDFEISDEQIIAFALSDYKVALERRLEKFNKYKETN